MKGEEMRTWKSHGAYALLASFLIAAPSSISASPPPDKVAPGEIEAGLVPDKATIMCGEPLYASFVLKNKSGRDLDVFKWEGVDLQGNTILGAADGKGAKVPENIIIVSKWEKMQEDMHFPRTLQRKIPAAGSDTERLFLPWRFEQPGVYVITARRTLSFSAKGLGYMGNPGDPAGLPVQASATITVVPADKAKMGEVIDGLLKTATHGGGFELNEADTTLLAMRDERVQPYLQELLDTGHGKWQEKAVDALLDFKNESALDRIKKFLQVGPDGSVWPPDASRAYAAMALSESSYPPAISYLVTLSNDRNAAVRQAVACALDTKVPPAQAAPILRQMCSDPAVMVRQVVAGLLQSKMPPAQAIPLLRQMEGDSDPVVRETAGVALANLAARPEGKEK
jgi:hypothetical protein